MECTCDGCGTEGAPCAEFPLGSGELLCPDCYFAAADEPSPVVNEGLSFDKFMDRTLLNESKRKTVSESKVHPMRSLQRGYQEHPLGKIRIGGK
jgi:hypothetical protein